MRKSKVIWTDIEVDAMAMQLVADLFGAVPEPGLNEITKAQRVLPEDRRRKCTGISQCKNVWARFQQMWAEAAAGKQTTPAAIEPTPAPEPVVEALPAGLDAFDTVVLLAEVLKRLSSPG
jgi:hypothetical protein